MNIQYKKKSGIYIIKCPINGKFYIGSATCIYTRWHTHIHLLKNKKHTNIHLQRLVNKYGLQSLIFGVVEFVDDLTLLVMTEQLWLDKMLPTLNICKKANTTKGVKLSAEVREHLSKIRKGKYPKGIKGENHSLEAREKISQKAKERIAKNGLHPNFKAASIKANIGRKHTFRHREIISKLQRKISPQQAFDIIQKRKSGVFQYIIAAKYNISQRLVVRIEKGIGVYGSREYKDYFEAQEKRFEKAIAEPLFDSVKPEQGKLL